MGKKFYQALIDVTDFFKDADFTPGIRPKKVWERVLFTPDVNTYLCESRPSLWFEVLDYSAEFPAKIADAKPEVIEAWDAALVDCDKESYYRHRSDVINSAGKILLKKFSFQGEYENDDCEEAVDDAFANHLV